MFFVFWHMQLYMSWYIRSFFDFTFLNFVYFFKYSCTNIFHRRSLYTFYARFRKMMGKSNQSVSVLVHTTLSSSWLLTLSVATWDIQRWFHVIFADESTTLSLNKCNGCAWVCGRVGIVGGGGGAEGKWVTVWGICLGDLRDIQLLLNVVKPCRQRNSIQCTGHFRCLWWVPM